MKINYNTKIVYLFIHLLLLLFFLINFCLIGCYSSNDVHNDNLTIISNEEFVRYDLDLFSNSKIYIPKPKTDGQMLSVIVKNKNDELVVFDGGRIEDGKYLCDFIKSFGGKVKYWFLTHIHDDHLGALYEIFKNYTNDIYIENLCYNFADFSWYYEQAGNDAYVLNLFNEAKTLYIDTLKKKNLKMNVYDNIHKNDVFSIVDIKIQILNNIYLLDSDSINNSSVVYKVFIEDKSMIVLGDLAYYGGYEFLKEYESDDILKSDIVVLAHHGQSGVDFPVYQKISPKIAIWPTSKYIYENISGNLTTDETKKWLYDLSVEYNIITYENNYILE